MRSFAAKTGNRYRQGPPVRSDSPVDGMLGSAVSSSSPNDFQPSSHKGLFAFPRIASHAFPPPPGKGYIPVGTNRALDSAIGLPSKSSSASLGSRYHWK